MCGSVLAAKAAAKVQDYSLSQLAPYSEMPRPSGSTDAMARWDAESLPACCRHRLELLKAFQYLEVPQFGRLLWIDAGWPRDWDQPAYLKFLDEAEKLSRPEVVREARRVARISSARGPGGRRRRRRFLPGPRLTAARRRWPSVAST